MRELALHLLDLAQNSLAAGASSLRIGVHLSAADDLLRLTVADNGRGIDPALLPAVADPFTTTRTTRQVGLGLPLLKAAAERCGGALAVSSAPGRGTTVTADFRLRHVDRAPLGDLAGTVLSLAACNPELDLELDARWDGGQFRFSTAECRRLLGPTVSLADPAVLAEIREYLALNLAGLREADEAGAGVQWRGT